MANKVVQKARLGGRRLSPLVSCPCHFKLGVHTPVFKLEDINTDGGVLCLGLLEYLVDQHHIGVCREDELRLNLGSDHSLQTVQHFGHLVHRVCVVRSQSIYTTELNNLQLCTDPDITVDTSCSPLHADTFPYSHEYCECNW